MEAATEAKKPECDLSSVDGNVYAIIGAVTKALRKAGLKDRAEEFKTKAMSSESYDAVLQLCFDYVEVS